MDRHMYCGPRSCFFLIIHSHTLFAYISTEPKLSILPQHLMLFDGSGAHPGSDAYLASSCVVHYLKKYLTDLTVFKSTRTSALKSPVKFICAYPFVIYGSFHTGPPKDSLGVSKYNERNALRVTYLRVEVSTRTRVAHCLHRSYALSRCLSSLCMLPAAAH